MKSKTWAMAVTVLGTIVSGEISDSYEYYGYDSPGWHSPKSRQTEGLVITNGGLSPSGIALALSVSWSAPI